MSHSRQRSIGFTLLEVIIAMTLMATLMTVVWSLFSTYTRLEERSSRTAVELQLVRSVSQQLRSDLEHFALLAELPKLESEQQDESEGSSAELGGDTQEDEPSEGDEQNDESESDEPQGDATPRSNSSNEFENTPGSVSASVVEGQAFRQAARQGGSDLRSLNQTLTSTLPDQTYLRGTATRLEIVTRLPYTVDVPNDRQWLGSESRYGTYQVVVFEWRDERGLESLLRDDPVLNPSKFRPPPPPVQTDPTKPAPPPVVAVPLNPNDNIGLVREVKSWQHAMRDRRMNDLKLQYEAAGLLVNGQLPPPDPREVARQQREQQQSFLDRTTQRTGSLGQDPASRQAPWVPPPEFRHKKDHIPEVTKLQFRYHDGSSWQLEWNDEIALPRAVEVAFDVDSDAPAVRAKEFEAAHQRMLGGASLTEVLPSKEELADDFAEQLDTLLPTNLTDPTAIVTEYRFVIALPKGPERPEDELPEDERSGEAPVEQVGDSLRPQSWVSRGGKLP